MGFLKDLSTPFNVTAGYAKLTKVTFEMLSSLCRIDISVWLDKASFLSGASPMLTKQVVIATDDCAKFIKQLRLREWLHDRILINDFDGAVLDEEDLFQSVLSVSVVGGATSASSVPVTVVFNRVVTSGEPQLTDFAVTNGSISNLATSDNITFTLDWALEEGVESTLQLSSASVQDTFDVDNIESNILTMLQDVVPAVLSSDEPSDTSSKSIPITLTFDRAVVGFSLSDFSVSNGSVNSLSSSDDIVFTFNLVVDDSAVSEIQLPASSVSDASAPAVINSVSNALSFAHDNVIAVLETEEASPTSNTTVPVTLTFDRAVSGLAVEDFAVVNCSISDLSSEDDIVFTFNLLVDQDVTSSVMLNASAVADAAKPAVINFESNILEIVHAS